MEDGLGFPPQTAAPVTRINGGKRSGKSVTPHLTTVAEKVRSDGHQRQVVARVKKRQEQKRTPKNDVKTAE